MKKATSRVLDYSPAAAKFLKKSVKHMPPKQREQIRSSLEVLETNPRPHNSEELTPPFPYYYKLKIGEYRAVYSFTETVVKVWLIGKRNGDEIYQDLRSMGVPKDPRKFAGSLGFVSKLFSPDSSGFKAWFSGSKVVDRRGDPLPVFHYTKSNLTKFLPFSHFGNAKAANAVHESEEHDLFDDIEGFSSGGKIFPVYLNIKNPYTKLLDMNEPTEEQVVSWLMKLNVRGLVSDKVWEAATAMGVGPTCTSYAIDNIIKGLSRAGYDGIQYKNTFEGGTSWVIFKPGQVWSALANKVVASRKHLGEFHEPLAFYNDITNYQHGQLDGTLYAVLAKDETQEHPYRVGYVSWTIYQGELSIRYIEVDLDFRRKGLGTQLIQRLRAEFPGAKYRPGMKTDLGSPFFKSGPVKETLRKIAGLVRKASFQHTAGRMRFFHGTSTVFWPSIQSQGLIPNPKKRVWEQGKSSPTSKGREPGAHSLESYPGAYVTNSYAKASSAAGNAVRNFGGDLLILSGEVETRSPDARVDEDHFTSPAGYLQQPGLHFNPREFPTQALPFLTGEPYYDVDLAAANWAEDLKIPEQALLTVLPLAKHLIVSETILNGILGMESSYASFLEKGYWWSGNTKQVYDAAKAKYGGELPSDWVRFAEQTYRSDVNALLAKITKYLEKKEQTGYSPSFRFEESPIGFSGSNFIDGAVSIPYRIEGVAPVTVLYRKGTAGVDGILKGFQTSGGYNYVLLERGKPPIPWVNERDTEMLRNAQSGKDPDALIQAFAQYGVDILQELGIKKQEKVASKKAVGSFYSSADLSKWITKAVRSKAVQDIASKMREGEFEKDWSWTQGGCFGFAETLASIFKGSEVWVVAVYEPDTQDWASAHAFVKIGNSFFDAEGETSPKEQETKTKKVFTGKKVKSGKVEGWKDLWYPEDYYVTPEYRTTLKDEIRKAMKGSGKKAVGSFYGASGGISTPDMDEVNALFEKLFKLNYRVLSQGEDEQETYELAWAVLFQDGKYKVLGPNRGEHAEVEFPGTDTDPIVGLLHTHPGGQEAELTDADEEVAQEVANRTGLPLLMGVIGTDPYDEDEGLTLVVDEFEPQLSDPAKRVVGCHYQARLTPVLYRGQEEWGQSEFRAQTTPGIAGRFTEDPSYAKSYGEVKAFRLKVGKPLDVFRYRGLTLERWRKVLEQRGLTGIVFDSELEEGQPYDFWEVLDPTGGDAGFDSNLIEMAKQAGYDAIIYEEGGTVLHPAKTWAAFSNDQIVPVQRVEASKHVGLHFRATYELSYATINKLKQRMPAKMSVEQFQKWLDSQQVPKEDRKWLGLDQLDALAEQGQVSKVDVVAYAESKAPKLEEKTLGNNTKDVETLREQDNKVHSDMVELRRRRDAIKENGGEAKEWEGYEVEINRLWDEHLILQKRIHDLEAKGGVTRYKKYSLPGGEDYREMMMKLPGGQPIGSYAEWLGERLGISTSEAEEAEEYDDDRFHEQFMQEEQTSKQSFHSHHWSDANVLLHTRYAQHQTQDGQNILIVEEVQSDWASKGKERGFKQPPPQIDIKHETDPNKPGPYQAWVSGELIGVGDTEGEARDDVLIRRPDTLGQVPDMPFKSSWPEYAMKRMLAMAAEKGYAYLGWPLGEEQKARYDLSKQVDAIQYYANKDGTFNIDIIKDGQSIEDEERADVKPEALANFVGKELALKIINGEGTQKFYPGTETPFRELSGLELQVGGAGMVAFYDLGGTSSQNVANFMQKYAKPHGSQVQQLKLKNGYTVWAVPITPALKAFVEKGQELRVASVGSRHLSMADSPAFKAWFSGSKVVDGRGKPLLVYHGTNGSEFSGFDPEYSYAFFTSSSDAASVYSGLDLEDLSEGAIQEKVDQWGVESLVSGREVGATIVPVYLSIKNPFVVNAAGKDWLDIPISRRIKDLCVKAGCPEAWTGSDDNTTNIDDLAHWAQMAGHDGLVVKNVVDSPEFTSRDIPKATTYVVFSPSQIKPFIERALSARTAARSLKERIQELEQKSADWLYKGNIAQERGDRVKAEKYYALSTQYLMKANDLGETGKLGPEWRGRKASVKKWDWWGGEGPWPEHFWLFADGRVSAVEGYGWHDTAMSQMKAAGEVTEEDSKHAVAVRKEKQTSSHYIVRHARPMETQQRRLYRMWKGTLPPDAKVEVYGPAFTSFGTLASVRAPRSLGRVGGRVVGQFYDKKVPRPLQRAGSYLLGEGGKLLYLYHGTSSAGFTSFKPGLDGFVYLTPSPEYAENYTSGSMSAIVKMDDAPLDQRGIYKVLLKDPIVFDTSKPEHRRIFEDEYLGKYSTSLAPLDPVLGLPDWTEAGNLKEFFEEMGYPFDTIMLADAHGYLAYAVGDPSKIIPWYKARTMES